MNINFFCQIEEMLGHLMLTQEKLIFRMLISVQNILGHPVKQEFPTNFLLPLLLRTEVVFFAFLSAR